MVRICIADSSTSDAEIICNLLERELDAKRISNSIDIVLSRNEIDKAINTLPAYQIFIICIDSKCPTFDWRRLSRELRKTKSLSKIVFISDRLEDAEEIFEYCPYYFLYRPNGVYSYNSVLGGYSASDISICVVDKAGNIREKTTKRSRCSAR